MEWGRKLRVKGLRTPRKEKKSLFCLQGALRPASERVFVYCSKGLPFENNLSSSNDSVLLSSAAKDKDKVREEGSKASDKCTTGHSTNPCQRTMAGFSQVTNHKHEELL